MCHETVIRKIVNVKINLDITKSLWKLVTQVIKYTYMMNMLSDCFPVINI